MKALVRPCHYLDELKQANSQALYKGGIREFGEELFAYESVSQENEND